MSIVFLLPTTIHAFFLYIIAPGHNHNPLLNTRNITSCRHSKFAARCHRPEGCVGDDGAGDPQLEPRDAVDRLGSVHDSCHGMLVHLCDVRPGVPFIHTANTFFGI